MAVKFTRRGKVTLALAALVGWACWNAAPDVTPDPVPSLTDQLLASGQHAGLLVDFEDGSDLAELRARYPDASIAWNSENVADEAIAVVTANGRTYDELLEAFAQDEDVEVAEVNAVIQLDPVEALSNAQDWLPDDNEPAPKDAFPNDPHYDKQWNMDMVHARDAWRYATGEDVIVAVIDTGVAYEDGKGVWAPDLKETRFVKGRDFVNKDDVAADDHGHGTHCAGTIAQSTDNGRGVVGLARNCKIMPLKVLSRHGSGTVADIVDAIRFAADNGAQVLSLSLGGGFPNKSMARAVAYARNKGCMVVCAAGNSYRPPVSYPAAYKGATAVSSVGPTGELAFYSSYGKQVFIAAPGGDKSKKPEDGVLQNTIAPGQNGKTVYAWYQGTSMATPHVAGASALLYSVGVTRPDAIESILKTTAGAARGQAEGSWNQKYGWGILDAGAAVHHAVFTPGLLALVLAGFGGVFLLRKHTKHVSVPLVALGGLAGACGLFFLRPLGLGEVPVVGDLLCRSMATWDIPLLGASWHWTPLFASALIPAGIGLVSVRSGLLRSLSVGLCLGWAARLFTGIALPYADVRFIPGFGFFDALWLGANGLILIGAAMFFVRRGQSLGQGGVSL